MERRIDFLPAFDKRNPDPRKNYGIHGVEMRWYVIGKHGVVQFVVYTNWQLPHVTLEHEQRWGDPVYGKPMAADLGYHSRTPRYEGQTGRAGCTLLPYGCTCYYDGSGLNAEPVLDLLITKGGDAVWKRLEEYYADTFGERE